MSSRKQNITAIADGCVTKPHLVGHDREIIVFYKKFGAVYDIAGNSPAYRSVGFGPSITVATNQFVIDGMRLAAQREIDKRRSVDDSVRVLSKKINDWFNRVAHQPVVDHAGMGVRTFMPTFHAGRVWFAGQSPSFDKPERIRDLAIGDEIARLAKLSFSALAVEYRKQVERADPGINDGWDRALAQDYADMIDDIACMRFGVGFYAPAAGATVAAGAAS